MPAFFATILILSCLVLVLEPLFRQKYGAENIQVALENHDNEFIKSREGIYQEIRTIQQEWFMQNLTEDQYRHELEMLRLKAATILKAQDESRREISNIQSEVDAIMDETT